MMQQEKALRNDSPKVMLYSPVIRKFAKMMSNDWIKCYLYPIEKITTFIREFLIVKNIESFDIGPYILEPSYCINCKKKITEPDVLDSFFSHIKKLYNPS